MTSNVERFAADLIEAHRQGRPFAPLARDDVPDIAAAYDIQDVFVARLCDEHRTGIAGYKIGLTSPTMQRMCGIDTPIAGAILKDRLHPVATVKSSDFGRLGVEFEFGVRLGRDLMPQAPPYDLDSVAAAVDGVCIAVELVDDRHADYSALDARSLVADNSWNAGAILGDFVTSWPDLADVEGLVSHDGKEIGRGFGRDLMGHPFQPLVWLVNHVTARGGTLNKGMVVLTGSLIQTQFPTHASAYSYTLGPFGSISFQVA